MAQNTKSKTLGLGVLSMFASQIVDFGATVGSKAAEKTESKSSNPLKGFNLKFDKAPKILESLKRRKILIAATLVFFVIFAFAIVGLSSKGGNSLINGVSQTNFSPAKQVTLNKKFDIPIRKTSGETTGNNLSFTLSTVDKSKRILIQGKPATSRDTKIFLIINMDVQNSTSDQLTVKPVDLIRFIDPQGKSFAPDVHNNEVIVEPISIKKTRVGFVVDENQENFKFTVGEINGPKETVEVNI